MLELKIGGLFIIFVLFVFMWVGWEEYKEMKYKKKEFFKGNNKPEEEKKTSDFNDVLYS